MKIVGVEMCPHCEDENEFEVDEGTWIINCKTCGRPIVLCDKCYTMYERDRDCTNCKHCKKCSKMNKKFEDEQIGKIVYWKDPDDDKCSNYCKIVGFEDYVYELSPLIIDEKGMQEDGSIIEAYGYELDFLTEEKQIEVLIGHFRECANWKCDKTS